MFWMFLDFYQLRENNLKIRIWNFLTEFQLNKINDSFQNKSQFFISKNIFLVVLRVLRFEFFIFFSFYFKVLKVLNFFFEYKS